MQQRWWGVIALFFGVNASSFGQNFEPDALFRRHVEQLDEARSRNDPTSSSLFKAEQSDLLGRLPQESRCVVIQRVNLSGFRHEAYQLAINGAKQQDPPQGKCLGTAGVKILMDRLQNALIADGFITARVRAPNQNLHTGQLDLVIQQGWVGRVSLPGGDIAPFWSTALAFKEGAVLNLRDIEQTLENWRRLPGAYPDIEIAPGVLEGASDVSLRIQAFKPWRLNIGLDDAGDRSTGRIQGSLTLHWDNPTNRADVFYVHASRAIADKSPGPRGQESHAVQYSLPIGYWGVTATLSQGRYHQQVAGAFQPYKYHGRSQQAELLVSRVVRRSADSKTAMSLQLFSRRSSNYIDDTEVVVQRRQTGGWELGLQQLQSTSWAELDIAFSHKRGTGAFGAMPAPEEPFGEGTSRMKLSQLIVTLRSTLEFLNQGHGTPTLHSTWRRQWAHSPLTPQDRFCFGGRYTVRGFDGTSSMCGERGWLVRNEIRLPMGHMPAHFYAGVDGGRSGGASAGGSPWLIGSVLGIRGSLRTPAPGQVDIDAFIALPLRKPSWFPTASVTSGISLQVQF